MILATGHGHHCHYQWMESQPLKKKIKENGKLTLENLINQIHQIFIDSWETGNGHEFQWTNNHPQYESILLQSTNTFFLLALMFLRILIQLTCRYSTLLYQSCIWNWGWIQLWLRQTPSLLVNTSVSWEKRQETSKQTTNNKTNTNHHL